MSLNPQEKKKIKEGYQQMLGGNTVRAEDAHLLDKSLDYFVNIIEEREKEIIQSVENLGNKIERSEIFTSNPAECGRVLQTVLQILEPKE